MARPRKHEHERRTTSVRADLTEAEKVFVQNQAAQAGLSAAEYTRRRILGHSVVPPAKSHRVDPALISELNRIGVNVNQLTRAINQGREFITYWRDIGNELRQVLATVLRAGERC